MTSRGWTTWIVLSFAFLVAGCGSGTTFVPIQGTVTVAGQPLAGVQVVFCPDLKSDAGGPQAVGVTDANGHYRLQAQSGDDGAVVGKYRVCITEPSIAIDNISTRIGPRRKGSATSSKARRMVPPPVDRPQTEPRVPANYGQFQDTPLRAEVRPGGLQTFDFNIP